MKYIEPKHWKYSEDLEGLLYFAQVLNECLFDFSIDTYKPNALNAHSITHEVLQIISKVRSKHIPEGNLKPLKEELLQLFSKDIAIKSILESKHEFYCKKIKQADNPDDLFHAVYSVHTYLDGKKYLERVKSLLSELVKDGCKKRDIFFLTRVLVTELMNYGYSKPYLYNITNKFFFQDLENKIKSASKIDEFLDKFSFEEEEFSVIFQVSEIFWEFRNSLKNVDFKLTKTLRDVEKNVIYKRFDTQKPKKKIYIIAHQVKALDHVSAREVVESRLNLFINLFHVFHHRSSLDVCDSCCVNRSSDNYTMILENDTNSLLKQKDLKANEAASKVDKLLENLSFSKRNNSMSRFMKALELHKLAIKTNEEENQLLDLWAALETLLQNKPESSLSRIEQISNSLIPFLSYGYTELLVIELFKDLWNWNSEVVDGLIQSVESDTSKRIEGLLKILVVKEFDEKRIELISKLDKYPLLKNRIFLYNKWFSSPKEMCSMIERHSQKLEWQIRRIYRARNMVIHHGGKPQHLKVLIENMGSYIHAIIEGLEFLMNDLKIRSIEHGVIEMEIAYKNNLDAIRANSDIKSENLKEIFLLNK
jgi:hypothetical protein